ncbi:hypothetical protein SBA5_110148 [Candidatus Sulfotelmatomonas gaucii]|uniref:Uncharacterized protein n=1 Tax=Candidatus Sulfuritelmatomonas gaucii TaxID=2043161 RepID=A0A2N9L3D3_9BACT|nr:hypothetical protein SBA5_110148 [Candidatus Sulfotelmatomonas gaucii]
MTAGMGGRTDMNEDSGENTIQPGSAVIVMEMSAARAEWVSAPTLMKSTPVSA